MFLIFISFALFLCSPGCRSFLGSGRPQNDYYTFMYLSKPHNGRFYNYSLFRHHFLMFVFWSFSFAYYLLSVCFCWHCILLFLTVSLPFCIFHISIWPITCCVSVCMVLWVFDFLGVWSLCLGLKHLLVFHFSAFSPSLAFQWTSFPLAILL